MSLLSLISLTMTLPVIISTVTGSRMLLQMFKALDKSLTALLTDRLFLRYRSVLSLRTRKGIHFRLKGGRLSVLSYLNSTILSSSISSPFSQKHMFFVVSNLTNEYVMPSSGTSEG